MKKFISSSLLLRLFLGLIVVLSGLVLSTNSYGQCSAADKKTFTDAVKLVCPTCVDANDQIVATEAAKVTSLDVSNQGVTCLEGIEYFVSITVLDCRQNNLVVIPDLKNNSLLETFNCSLNQITTITNLSGNNNLQTLDCGYNNLTSLPSLAQNIFLNRLDCTNNLLTQLPDLSANRNLIYLLCYNNQLSSLPNLDNNSFLQYILCYNNKLTALPELSGNSALQYLYCNYNELTSIPNLSKNTNLQDLQISNNPILELSCLPNSLLSLSCTNTQLSCLPSGYNTSLVASCLTKDPNTGLYPTCGPPSQIQTNATGPDGTVYDNQFTVDRNDDPCTDAQLGQNADDCNCVGTLRWAVNKAATSTLGTKNRIVFNLPAGSETITLISSLPTYNNSTNRYLSIDGRTQPNYTPSRTTDPLVRINLNSFASAFGMVTFNSLEVQNVWFDNFGEYSFSFANENNSIISLSNCVFTNPNGQAISGVFYTERAPYHITNCTFGQDRANSGLHNGDLGTVAMSATSSIKYLFSDCDFHNFLANRPIDSQDYFNILCLRSLFVSNTKNIAFSPSFSTSILGLTTSGNLQGSTEKTDATRVEIYETNAGGIDAVKYMGTSLITNGTWEYNPSGTDPDNGAANLPLEAGKRYIAVSSTDSYTGEFSAAFEMPQGPCANFVAPTSDLYSKDGMTFDSVFVVTRTDDFDPTLLTIDSNTDEYSNLDDCPFVGTLRWATLKAAQGTTALKKRIVFALPAGSTTITLTSNLQIVNSQSNPISPEIWIDGSTQSGYVNDVAVDPTVRIDFGGQGISFFQDRMTCHFQGLFFSNFGDKALFKYGSNSSITWTFDNCVFANPTGTTTSRLFGIIEDHFVFNKCTFGSDRSSNGSFKGTFSLFMLAGEAISGYVADCDFQHFDLALNNSSNYLVKRSLFETNGQNIAKASFPTTITGINSGTNLLAGTTPILSATRLEIYETNAGGIDAVKYMGTSPITNGTWEYDPSGTDPDNGAANLPLGAGKRYIAVSSTDSYTGEFSTAFLYQPTCLVTNTDDSGDGSLRAAIDCAKSKPGLDTIRFAIPGSGKHTITLASTLDLSDSICIDGFSQSGNPNQLDIAIEGSISAYQKNLITIQGLELFTSLDFWGVGNCRVLNNKLSNCPVNVFRTPYAEVNQNAFTGANAWVYVKESAGTKVIGNSFSGTNYIGGAIYGSDSDSLQISLNSLSSIVNYGIRLTYSKHSSVDNNVLWQDTSTTSSYGYGLSMEAECKNTYVGFNQFFGFQNAGVYFGNRGDSNRVSLNTIGYGNVGIKFSDGYNGHGNAIRQNYIGVDNNTAKLGIKGNGMEVFGYGLIVEQNTIGYCDSTGIVNLGGSYSGETPIIRSNFIGTSSTGIAIPNKIGVLVKSYYPSLLLQNTIKNNARAGVLNDANSSKSTFSQNSISNNPIGILLYKGVGNFYKSNDDILAPQISTLASSTFTDSLQLSGTADRDGILELFVGDGKKDNALAYLKAVSIATGNTSTGSRSWTAQIPKSLFVSSGLHLIATLTDAQGNTSAFSEAFTSTPSNGKCIVTNTLDDENEGSLRAAINCANLNAGPDSIIFKISGVGPHVIQPLTNLPAINSDVVLDGFTQSGKGVFDVVLDGSTTTESGLILGGGNSTLINSIQIKGLEIRSFLYDGIISYGSLNQVTISSNILHDNHSYAINLSDVVHSEVTNNKTYGQGGIQCNKIETSLFLNNVLNDSESSITLYNTENIIVRQNLIGTDSSFSEGNTGSYGLTIGTGNKLAIVDNNIIGNKNVGVAISSGDSVSLNHNFIGTTSGKKNIKCTTGVWISGGRTYLVENTIANSVQTNVNAAGSASTKLRNTVVSNSSNDNFVSSSTFKPTITGYNTQKIVFGTSNPLDSIEVYESDGRPANAPKAPLIKFLGITKTDAKGNWQLQLPDTLSAKGKKYYLVALATTIEGNTSDLSNQLFASDFSGNCVVTNTSDSGEGSLREAIGCANNSTGSAKVIFNIPSNGPHIIQPQTELPEITGNVTIDGSTQKGYANDSIIIDGANTISTGFTLYGDRVQLKRLTIRNFSTGVYANGVRNRFDSLNLHSNGSAIRSYSRTKFSLLNGCTIHLNTWDGFTCYAEDTIVVSNCVINENNANGLGLSTMDLPAYYEIKNNLISNNGLNGIYLAEQLPYNSIIKNNIIYGNGRNGIFSSAKIIKGNVIGYNPTTMEVKPNAVGISLGGNARSAGFAEIIDSNYVCGNSEDGMYNSNNPNVGRLTRNYVGVTHKGTILGNEKSGIIGAFNKVGGKTIDSANVICGNGEYGIFIYSNFSNSNSEYVNNYIGITQNGKKSGNLSSGLYVKEGRVEGNVIGANKKHGIESYGNASILNNYVGTDTSGNNFGNDSTGIRVAFQELVANNHVAYNNIGLAVYSSSNTIKNNYIKNNKNDGVRIFSPTNRLTRNLFDGTREKAIDLFQTSPTLIGNNNKPAPIISSFSYINNLLTLSGTSQKGDSIEVFLNDSSNAQTATQYLGHTKTDTDGNWSIALTEHNLSAGKSLYFVATADSANNTSELSTPFKVKLYDGDCVVKNVNDAGEGSLREAITCANQSVKKPTIRFEIDGTDHTIALKSYLPKVQNIFGDSVVIDGSTQAGYIGNVGDSSIVITKTTPFDTIGIISKKSSTFSKIHLIELTISDVHPLHFFNGGIIQNVNFKNSDIRFWNKEEYQVLSSSFINTGLVTSSDTVKVKKLFVDNTTFSVTTNSIPLNFHSDADSLVVTNSDFKSPNRQQFYSDSKYCFVDSCSFDGRLEIIGAETTIFKNSNVGCVTGADSVYHIIFGLKKLLLIGNEFGGRSIGNNYFLVLPGTTDSLIIQNNAFGYSQKQSKKYSIDSTIIYITSNPKHTVIDKNVFSNANTAILAYFNSQDLSTRISNNKLGLTNNPLTEDALILNGGSHLFIEQNTFENDTISSNKDNDALYLNNCTSLISKNTFKASGANGINLNAGSANVSSNIFQNLPKSGIHAESGVSLTVDSGNTFSNCREYGIDLGGYSSTTSIKNNTFEKNGIAAIRLASQYSSGNYVGDSNQFINNTKAIILATANTVVENNRFQTDSLNNGILVRNVANPKILNNTATSDSLSSSFISFDSASTNQVLVKGNQISGYQQGINIDKSSKLKKLSQNILVDNETAIDLNLGSSTPGNESKSSPFIQDFRLSNDTLLLTGTSQAQDTVELFLSDGKPQNATKYLVTGLSDANGKWTLPLPKFALDTNQNYYFVATSTNVANNTSQLSNLFKLKLYDGNCVVKNVSDEGDGSLREAIHCANYSVKKATISFAIDGAGPHVIEPGKSLAGVRNIFGDSVIIDGFSQASYAGATGDKQISIKTNTSASNGILVDTFSVHHTRLEGLLFDSTSVYSDSSVINSCQFKHTELGIRNYQTRISNSTFENLKTCISHVLGSQNSCSVNNCTFKDYATGITGPAHTILKSNLFYGDSSHSADVNLTYNGAGSGTFENNYFTSGINVGGSVGILTMTNNHLGIWPDGTIPNREIKGVYFGGTTLQLTGNVLGNTNGEAIHVQLADTISIRKNRIGISENNLKLPIDGDGILVNTSKTVNLIDSNIIANTNQNGITILRSMGFVINGNTVGSEGNPIGKVGLSIQNSAQAILKNNSISYCDSIGIAIQSSSQCKIETNAISHLKSTGIYLVESDSSSLLSNKIHSTYTALELNTTANLRINNNTLDSNQYGMYIGYVSHSVLEGNQLTANNNGIQVFYGGSDTLKNNQVRNSTNGGIGFTSSGDHVVANNKLIDNATYGISLFSGASNVQVLNNLVQAQDTTKGSAIQVSMSAGNLILNDTLIGYRGAGSMIFNGQAKVSRTSIDHATKAIDLNLSSTPGNNSKAKPTLTSVIRRGNKLLLRFKSEKGDSVEVFTSATQRQRLITYSGTYFATDTGETEVELPASLLNIKDTLVLRATATAGFNTSEISDYIWTCPACTCLVTTTQDNIEGSFRQAINKANQGTCGNIAFKISVGTEADTMSLQSALPEIYNTVNIDGSTESGYSANQDPVIWLSDKSFQWSQGLYFTSLGSSAKAIGISGFQKGVVLTGEDNTLSDMSIGGTQSQFIAINGNGNKVDNSQLGTTYTSKPLRNASGAGVTIEGNHNALSSTKIANTQQENLQVKSGNGNTFSGAGSSLSASGYNDYAKRIGIQLEPTTNDGIEKPSFDPHQLTGTGIQLNGKAEAGARVQIYKSNGVREQALLWLGETIANGGVWSFATSDYQPNDPNAYVATATNANGSTSPLSNVYRVGVFVEICPVTNVNDAGEGTFREAVNCANNSDIKAKIDFQLDNTPQEIRLTTSPTLRLLNDQGVEIDASSKNISIVSTIPSNLFYINSSNTLVKGLNFHELGIEVTDGQQNTFKRNSFEGVGLSFIGNSDGNTIDSNTFAHARLTIGMGSVPDPCLCAASNTITHNILGWKENGSPSAIDSVGIAVLSKEGGNIISENTIGNIQKVGAWGMGILSVQPNGLVSKNELGSANTILAPIQGTAIWASGKGTRIVSNDIQYADTAIAIGGKLAGTSVTSLGIELDGLSVEDNTIDHGNGAGIVVDAAKQVLITKNLVKEPGTGKGIVLNHGGNANHSAPSIYKYTVYENQLRIWGKSVPNDIVELFKSTDKGQRSMEYLLTFSVDGNGEWTTTIPLDKLNTKGENYLVATGRDALNNTSEFGSLFNANLNVCLVTSTQDTGPNTLRFAIDTVNLGKCNLIQFNLPTSGTSTSPIQLETVLPKITASNVIVDGTSQPNYLPSRMPQVLVTTVSRLPQGLVSTANQNFSMHGLSFDNFETSIALENSPNAYVRKNKISGSNLGISIDALSGNQTWVDENEINGSEAGHEVSKGILSLGQKCRINGNTLFTVQNTGIQAEGDSLYVQYNTLWNVTNVNSASPTDAAISVLRSSRVIVQSNQLFSSGSGIVLSETVESYVSYNKLDSARGGGKDIRKNGISLQQSHRNIVEWNTLSDSLQKGIELNNSNDNLVRKNKVYRCEKALYLTADRHNRIKSNELQKGTYGIWQETGSREDSLLSNSIHTNHETAIVLKGNANLLYGNTVGNIDPTRALNNSLGILVESDSNFIGRMTGPNLIINNRFGGISITGKQNKVVYNQLVHNDTSIVIPLSLAIDLNNKIGNEGIAAPHIDTYKRLTDTTFDIFGSSAAGDSIHLYTTFGFTQEARRCVGTGIADGSGKWTVRLEAEFVERYQTNYVVATATNSRRNTSQLSNMIAVGYCFITSTQDNGNNEYPIPGSVRAAVGCANSVPESAKILNAINGSNDAGLVDTLPYLKNPLGVVWNGQHVRAKTQRLTISSVNKKATSGPRFGEIGHSEFRKMTLVGFDTAAVLHQKTVVVDSITTIGSGTVAFALGQNTQRSSFSHLEASKYSSLVYHPTKIDSLFLDSSKFSSVKQLFGPQTLFQNSVIQHLNWNNFERAIKADKISHVKITESIFSSTKSSGISSSMPKLIEAGTADSLYFASNQNSLAGFKDELSSEYISLLHATYSQIRDNGFHSDSAHIFIRLGTDSLQSYGDSIISNSIVNKGIGLVLSGKELGITQNGVQAKWHAVLARQLSHSTLSKNNFNSSDSAIVRLEQSSAVQLTQTTLEGNKGTTKAINLNKTNDVLYSNHRRFTPQIVNDGLGPYKGKTRRILYGLARPKDHIEIFFSDSAQANAYQYLADTIQVDADGKWQYVLPREWNKEHKHAKFLTVTATDTNFNTSELSNVYRLDTLLKLVYVLNTDNSGPNSLRWAIEQVNSTEFYTKVIFKIPEKGPHIIAVKDSALPTLYNYSGFVMDGGSQKDSSDTKSDDQVVIVDGLGVDSSFAFNILPEVGADSRINELQFVNFEKGIKLQSETVKLDSLRIYSKNALNKDTAIFAVDSSQKASAFSILHCDIVGYETGIWLGPYTKKALIAGNRLDSVSLGVVLSDSAAQCQLLSNYFVNVDSTALLAHNAGLENLIRENWFGYDTTKGSMVHVMNNGIWLQNTIGAIVDSNRFITITASDSSLQNGKGIVLSDGSSNNNIANNYFGWHTSLPLPTNLPSDTTSAIALIGNSQKRVSDNRITGNRIGNSKGIGISMSYTSDNVLAGNLLGITFNRKDTLAMDTVAILIQNGLREQVTGNTVARYRGTAIDLYSSENISMHQNELFSTTDTSKAIRLALGTNKDVSAPQLTKWEIVDTNTIRIYGKSLYTNGTIELFIGRQLYSQALTYIDRVDIKDTSWSILVKKPFFSLDKEYFFVATYTDLAGNTSELGGKFGTKGLLCKLDSLVLPKQILTCPGVETELDAGITNMNYTWTAANNSPFELSANKQKIKIKEVDDYTVLVEDDFGCKLSKKVEFRLYEKPYEVDFIINKKVHSNDTVAIVDIAEQPFSDPSLNITWDYGGGIFLKDLSKKDPRTQYVVFPDSSVYKVTATSILGVCKTVTRKTVTAVPKGTTDSSGTAVVLPSEVKMEKVSVYPVPVYDCCFNVDLQINDTVDVQIYLVNLQGADIQKYVIPKTDLYKYNDTFKLTSSFDVSSLPAGFYVVRIMAGQDSKEVKIEIL